MVVRIHPGQSCVRCARRARVRPRWIPAGLLALAASVPAVLSAQGAVQGADTAFAPSGDEVLDAARSAQARFERERVRDLPLTYAGPSGECDERVGRLCLWYGNGHWHPEPDRAGVTESRQELLSTLDSLQLLSPADGWILGQRVWYRGESGEWAAALEAARQCGGADGWWCAALEGLALHGLGRFESAARSFERALAAMDPERALEWRVPSRAVDGDGRDALEYLVVLDDGSLEPLLERLWTLADPLYLVDGNDRMTAHYARWTVSAVKEDARNPHALRWGGDFEEVTVRNGWEIGWERARTSPLERSFSVVGHEIPDGRDYMPAGRALADPTRAEPGDLTPGWASPRSLYTAPYAPVLLPIDAAVTVIARGDSMVVVAVPYLPEDTTLRADHDHPEPVPEGAWWSAGRWAGEERIGLFAVPLDGGTTRRATRVGTGAGALSLVLPVGAWLISAESWSPAHGLAGRQRLGIERARPPEDVASLSDILLLEAGPAEPSTLEEAVRATLPRGELPADGRLAVGWMVNGLGFRDETLRYDLSVERTDRGFFRRVGELFGLADRPASLALSWEEPAPERPGPQFRHLALDLPEPEPGRYEVTLVLHTAGRSEVVTRRTFRVVQPEESPPAR